MADDIKRISLNSNTRDTKPFVIRQQGRRSETDWWQKIATFPAYDSLQNAMAFHISGAFGGYYRTQQLLIDLDFTNRGTVAGESGVTVLGIYKPPITIVSSSYSDIEVYDNDGVMAMYLHHYSYTTVNLACYVYDHAPAGFSFDYNGLETFQATQPEGNKIWSLKDDMSPTPDIDRVAAYITNPLDDSYAQQVLPRYDEEPETPIDLNDYMTPGIYKSGNNTQTTRYVINKPQGLATGFILRVFLERGSLASTEVWRTQEISAGEVVWRRQLNGVTETWSDWVRTDLNAIQAGANITKTIDNQGRVMLSANTYTKDERSGEVKLIAHRGAMEHAPENTIPAFEIAGQQGFYGIEFDVIQTADDEFVVFHDTTADRMTDGTGRIQDMTLAEIQALTIDAGADIQYYPELKIPTLDQTLQAIRKTNAIPIIELKYTKTENFADIVDIVAANGMLDRAVFISFFESYLDGIRNVYPEARAWLVVNQVTEQIVDNCAAKGFGVDAETWTQDLVKYANKKNVEVGSWSAANQTSYLSREEIGVEFITTNAIECCRVRQSPNTVDGSGFKAYSNYEASCLTLGKYIPRQLSGSTGLDFTSVIFNSADNATRGFVPKIYHLNGATAINYNFTDTKYEGILVTLRFFDSQHKQLTDQGWFGHGSTTFTDIPAGAEYCFVYAGTAAGIPRMTYARQQLLAEMVRSITLSYGGT